MQLLYAARYARFDLLCAVSKLAQRIVTWDARCDAALYRLICYVNTTLSWRQIGYVGDALQDVSLHLYADADFAGDSTKKSTTGLHLAVRGVHQISPARSVEASKLR